MLPQGRCLLPQEALTGLGPRQRCLVPLYMGADCVQIFAAWFPSLTAEVPPKLIVRVTWG